MSFPRIPLLVLGLTMVLRGATDPRQVIVNHYDQLVPTILQAQRTAADPADPHGIRVGEFRDTFNCRQQEAVYVLAYLYTEARSAHYHAADLLRRVLLSLDYLCRAQGRNGGYNEYAKQGGWVGVALPDGGNATRKDGKSSVVGFTLYCVGRSIVVLKDEPAFQQALAERIDHDGDGQATITRREAYRYLVGETGDDGRLGGIAYLHGNGRGHAPNQDTGALAAVQALDAAYAVLSGERALDDAHLAALRDNVLFGRTSDLFPQSHTWFSDKGMVLEHGHGGLGYDANYSILMLRTLGAYAIYAQDEVAKAFVRKFMDGLQYYFVLDDTWPKGAYQEFRTARRSPGPGGIPLFVAGVNQGCHDALRVLYAAGLQKLAADPAPFFPDGVHLFQLESSEGVDLLLNWQEPMPTGYVFPANREATFAYADPQANLKVVKTGPGPETVMWSADNYDGGTVSYTYEPPGR